jgi:quinol monooxygenase YgiN
MTVLAVTRLSVRSLRFLPGFIWHAVRSERQARNAQGCVATDVRREKLLVFWTRTAWRDEAAMRAYMTSGAHKKVMPKLRHWCNEASVVHWSDAVGQLPDWNLAQERLRRDGRVSRVRYPSPAQTQGLTVP